MSAVATPAPAQPPRAPRRFTVGEYHRMLASGILSYAEQIELLEGWILPKMPQHPDHRRSCHKSRRTLEPLLPPGWFLEVQAPITTADSEPEPDMYVARGSTDDNAVSHPRGDQLALALEIADNSLYEDRKRKLPIYARARVPIYWIVNLAKRQVEVYTQPTGLTYQHRQDYPEAANVPLVIDGQAIAQLPVASFLP